MSTLKHAWSSVNKVSVLVSSNTFGLDSVQIWKQYFALVLILVLTSTHIAVQKNTLYLIRRKLVYFLRKYNNYL